MVLECNKRKVGGWYEKIAANYLEKNGLQIKVMNYRCKLGKIDLIARDGDELVFVEVKYRSSGANGDAIESVGYGKRKTISRVAKFYLMTHYHTVDLCCRFDVIGINGNRIKWLKNAFEYTE